MRAKILARCIPGSSALDPRLSVARIAPNIYRSSICSKEC